VRIDGFQTRGGGEGTTGRATQNRSEGCKNGRDGVLGGEDILLRRESCEGFA